MARIVMALALLAGLAGSAMGQDMAQTDRRKGYELPAYRVTFAEGAREIRDYAPRLVAEVTVQGARRPAINTGFRLLAGYIFGGNATGTKIAMTVPVDQADQGGDLWTVRFTLPAALALETLPKPDEPRLVLRALPPQRMVSESFSGLPDSAALAKRAAALADWARGQGLTLAGGPIYSFYDAPWSVPWARRNEVGFELR